MRLYRVRRNFTWGQHPYPLQYKAWAIDAVKGVEIGIPRQTIDSRDRVGFIVDLWAVSLDDALVHGILLLNDAGLNTPEPPRSSITLYMAPDTGHSPSAPS